jgi:hypothetical protein
MGGTALGQSLSGTATGSPTPPIEPLSDWTKPSVVISVISAAIGLVSAATGLVSLAINKHNQTVSFQKDAAAIARDIKAKKANAVIQAFENNVARPIGMVLDQIERLATDMTKLSRVTAKQLDAAANKYVTQLAADNANLLRLCREADGGLIGRSPVFLSACATALLDAVLFRAGYETLSGTRPAQQSAGVAAMEMIGSVKIKLRQLLEIERVSLVEAQTGSIVDDPYYPQLQELLGPDFATRTAAATARPNSGSGDASDAGQRQA